MSLNTIGASSNLTTYVDATLSKTYPTRSVIGDVIDEADRELKLSQAKALLADYRHQLPPDTSSIAWSRQVAPDDMWEGHAAVRSGNQWRITGLSGTRSYDQMILHLVECTMSSFEFEFDDDDDDDE